MKSQYRKQCNLIVRISLFLFLSVSCLPTTAQNETTSRSVSLGVITSYFGRHPKLQAFANLLASHIVSVNANTREFSLLPFELTPGNEVKVNKETIAPMFPQSHFLGGGNGHDNERAMRYLTKTGRPWILISNGPSVAGVRQLTGGKEKLFANVVPVQNSGMTLYVYFSEIELEKSSNLTSFSLTKTNVGQEHQLGSAEKSIGDSSLHGPIYTLILCTMVACIVNYLQYRNFLTIATETNQRVMDVVTSSRESVSEIGSLQEKVQHLVIQESLHEELLQRSDNLESIAIKNNSEITGLQQHEGASVSLDSGDSRLDQVILLLESLAKNSVEVANLRQSLAEKVVDVKRVDESILSFASLLFRISSQTDSSNLDRNTADYLFGRLARYFERVGINVIVPIVGDDYVEDLHSIHGTELASSDDQHMKIVEVHEIGLRRGNEVVRPASVTIRIRSVSE